MYVYTHIHDTHACVLQHAYHEYHAHHEYHCCNIASFCAAVWYVGRYLLLVISLFIGDLRPLLARHTVLTQSGFGAPLRIDRSRHVVRTQRKYHATASGPFDVAATRVNIVPQPIRELHAIVRVIK